MARSPDEPFHVVWGPSTARDSLLATPGESRHATKLNRDVAIKVLPDCSHKILTALPAK